MRFYVFSPTFYLRPKNTDWLYNCSLPQIRNFTEGLDVYLQQAFLPSLIMNVRSAAAIARSRFRLPIPPSFQPTTEAQFSLHDLLRSGADVIYGHSPSNVHHLPLIFHTGPNYERAMRDLGVPQVVLDWENAGRVRAIRRSHLVTLHTRSGAETIKALAPEASEKIRSVPFFLPHLHLSAQTEIECKFANLGTIKLLFVGREARRKGLPAVLSAFQAANARYPGRLELEIISTLANSSVDIPVMPNIRHIGEASRVEVNAAMRKSHILLMPSVLETYGLVYLEAMAAGAIAMACDGPAQREIVADGDGGILVQPNADAVTAALMKLLAHPEEMLPLALRGWARVKDVFMPRSVAERMKEFGIEAKERFRAGKL